MRKGGREVLIFVMSVGCVFVVDGVHEYIERERERAFMTIF